VSCARYSLSHLIHFSQIIGCDFIISAVGVVPCTSFLFPSDDSSTDLAQMIQSDPTTGAILINECFETSCPHIYAAGDCCTVYLSDTETETNKNSGNDRHWFQMRLWSQARSMGIGAAHSLYTSLLQPSESVVSIQSESLEAFRQRADDIWGGVMFNIFAHVTHFFGHKVRLHSLDCFLWSCLISTRWSCWDVTMAKG
jgi:pyridine nucleotide-disulfide oxidoreductase domain-containing protein 1